MLIQTEAQIYLAAQRGTTTADGFLSFHTLHFESYRAEGRAPFGRLLAFNEETLAAEVKRNISVSVPTEVILLPIAGGLELIDSDGESIFVGTGESFRFLAFPESRFQIVNPYAVETINYLQVHLIPDAVQEEADLNDKPFTKFSLADQNVLIPVFAGLGEKVTGLLGKYEGRAEDEYRQNANAGIFIYILQGAFEVQNRLLEKGDALSLVTDANLEFEALSNDAIILVMEVGM